MALQHMPEAIAPLCAPSFDEASGKHALLPGGAARRVWLPSRRIELSLPREPLSAPNAPGLCPSELFSFRMIEGRFPFPFPLLRFPTRPVRALYRRFSGFIPPGKPCPSSPPDGLDRAGAVCSLGIGHLPGSPAGNPLRKASPFPDLPSRSSLPAVSRRSGE
jgi:hypothetical protein